MRLVGRLLVGLALAVVLIGSAVAILVQPWFTRIVSARVSEFSAAGLTSDRGVQLAEGVREYVSGVNADPDQDLPATVDGRAGFGPDERKHLEDVKEVIDGARLITGLVGAVITIWLLVEVVRRRTLAIAAGLRMGAYMGVAGVVLAGIAGLTSFDWLFTRFHELFFEAGTWTFPADSLLIQLFPEPFWVTAAAAVAGLVILGAILLWFAALWLENTSTEPSAAASTGPRERVA